MYIFYFINILHTYIFGALDFMGPVRANNLHTPWHGPRIKGDNSDLLLNTLIFTASYSAR
jgi:hypothetical protein